jgi:hypothetical protein
MARAAGGVLYTLTLMTVLVAAAAPARRVQAQDGPQPSSDAAALGRELFTQGRALMDAGEYDVACPKLAESHRLDPGGGTLLNLALCHENQGKTATAWAEFDQALRVARADGRSDREEFARTHLDALTPKLSRLRIDVPLDARIEGLSIKRNGVGLGSASWGQSIPVDPGDQVIEVTAPDKLPRRYTVTVNPDGDNKSLSIQALVDAPLPPPPPPPPPAPRPEPPDKTPWQVSGGIITVLGAGALAVSIFLGVSALELAEEAEATCPSLDSCDGAAISKSKDAVAYGNTSTGVLVAGGVLSVLGVFLLVYPEVAFASDEESGASVSVLGLGARGVF